MIGPNEEVERLKVDVDRLWRTIDRLQSTRIDPPIIYQTDDRAYAKKVEQTMSEQKARIDELEKENHALQVALDVLQMRYISK